MDSKSVMMLSTISKFFGLLPEKIYLDFETRGMYFSQKRHWYRPCLWFKNLHFGWHQQRITSIRIDNKLNWKAHINDIAFKLIRANAMLYKVRDFADAGILKSIYYALFELHIHYPCIIWGQNVYTNSWLFILQKKALRLILFKKRNAHTAPLFFKSKIVNFSAKLKLKLVISSATMSTTNYLPSLIAGLYFPPFFITMKLHLQPKVI